MAQLARRRAAAQRRFRWEAPHTVEEKSSVTDGVSVDIGMD